MAYASAARAAAVSHLGEHLQLLTRQPMAKHVTTERPTESAARPTEDAPHVAVERCAVDNGPAGDGIECAHAPARVHTSTACVGERTRRAYTASIADHHGSMAAHV